MAWTQLDLDAINDAIASGAMRVKYADKEIQYTSLNDLKQVKSLIEQALNNKPRQARRYGVFVKI